MDYLQIIKQKVDLFLENLDQIRILASKKHPQIKLQHLWKTYGNLGRCYVKSTIYKS